MVDFTITYECQNGIEREYRTSAVDASTAIAEVFAERSVANIIKVVNEFTGQIDDKA